MGSSKQLQQLTNRTIKIGEETIVASSAARNIGAVFDEKLTMKDLVLSACKSCYIHLRHIGKVRPYLTQDASIRLVHAFIASKLDQVNAILYGISKYLLGRYQKIQNNAAHIVTRRKRRDHITPILVMSINKHVEYKILLTTFKALHGLSPGYIADLIQTYVPP